MKALNKGKASELFKRQNLPKLEDPKKLMNDLEAKEIAIHVGISQEQMPSFEWFFEQVSKLQLPEGFDKKLNEQKTSVLYVDKESRFESTRHPLLDIIKTFFYTQLSSEKSTFTFEKKKNKLMPYVEEKMMKSCLSLSSKRRQVEKVNVQKDQNGKNVLSKMARIRPDLKVLISARSYMLKMLIEKLYTKKQIWGKGKRAKVLADLLNEKVKDAENEEEEDGSHQAQDLETYQRIFLEAAHYFEQEYGNLKEIPQYILESKAFTEATPENVLRNLLVLGIEKSQIKFYWLARLMDCLQLPPSWSKSKGNSFDIYTYEPLKMNFDVHPSYIYIINQMNTFKSEFDSYSEDVKAKYYSQKQMRFFDFFERPYKVDIYGMVVNQEQRLQMEMLKSSGESEQSADQLKEKLSKNHNFELAANDWMVVEGFVNSKLSSEALPLLENVINFWTSKYFPEEEYIPSISPFGEVTWSSTVNYSAIDYCPYETALKSMIDYEVAKLPVIEARHFKSTLRGGISITDEKTIKPQMKSQASIQLVEVSEQREEFLRYYLEHISLPNPLPYYVEGPQLLNSFYDEVFICPFDLSESVENLDFDVNGRVVENSIGSLLGQQNIEEDQEDDDEIPVWIEMVRARKLSARIKNLVKYNHDFAEMRAIVVKYALDMVRREEPHRLTEVEEKIRNLKDNHTLLNFLNEVTDIEAREERKKKLLQFQNKQVQNEAENEDIFGSELSNVDPEEVSDSQQSSSFVAPESEEESKSQNQNQENELSSSYSDSQQESQHSQKQVAEPSEESRQEYSFLKNEELYQTSPYFDKVDSETLDLLLKKKIKNKLKRYKYSCIHIKAAFKSSIRLRFRQDANRQNQNIKKNLIITDLESNCLPYRDLQILKFDGKYTASQYLHVEEKEDLANKRFKKNKGQNSSEIDFNDQCDMFRIYESEMEEYDQTDELMQVIQQKKRERQEQKRLKELETQRRLQEEEAEKKRREEQVEVLESSDSSFELQPIKRVKPDIQLDPRLRHISTIDTIESEVGDFRKTFTSGITKKQTPQNDKKDETVRFKVRTKSVSSIRNPESQSKSSNLKRTASSRLIGTSNKDNKAVSSTKRPSNYSSQQQNSILKSKMLETSRESGVFNKNTLFNRVCLSNTATAFLSTEPIRSKSQLIVIEARKTLLQKGRGLETYLSKKY